MRDALRLARKAYDSDEVPVGAVIVFNKEIIGEGYNQTERLKDPTAHAELLAIREAATKTGWQRLIDAELYTTLEPCIMCAGAIWQARIKKVIFGCFDPKGGAYGSLYTINEDKRLNHQVETISGILAEECAGLLRAFFREKRERCQSG